MEVGEQGAEARGAHCEGSVSLFVLALHAYTQPFGGVRVGKHSSVGPVGGAAIAGLAALGLLLHAAGLIALTRTTLRRKNKVQ